MSPTDPLESVRRLEVRVNRLVNDAVAVRFSLR
jgi:hypothetical protein